MKFSRQNCPFLKSLNAFIMKKSVTVSIYLNSAIANSFIMIVKITCLLLMKIIFFTSYIFSFFSDAILFVKASR